MSLHAVLFSGLCVNWAMNSHSAANLKNFSEVFIVCFLCVACDRRLYIAPKRAKTHFVPSPQRIKREIRAQWLERGWPSNCRAAEPGYDGRDGRSMNSGRRHRSASLSHRGLSLLHIENVLPPKKRCKLQDKLNSFTPRPCE